ncbi:MAG TPA: proton-conducting transporter membrane subunit [Candidatus Omnitrophota bacterium]|nr:proton-conducting transporter membrane subunit [Candidatus Omnitrophota bacterium]
MKYLLPLLIALPLLGAALAPLFCRINRRSADILILLVTLFSAAIAVSFYWPGPANEAIVFHSRITLALDGLSRLLVLAASGVAFFVAVYSTAYMEKHGSKDLFYSLFMLMLAGIYGVILAGDLMVMYISLEVAALSAYALVAFGFETQKLEASFKYFIMGEAASALILVAIGLVRAATGTFDMAEVSLRLQLAAPYIKAVSVGLFLTGFGMKAALFPFHAWLPDAHTAAPSPVSAMLSGVIIKSLGVYAIVRIAFNLFGFSSTCAAIVVTLGALTILVGGFMGIGQWDIKRLMAFSSVSQVGYIALGLGLATPLGVMGGLYHLFNHAIMKSLLFLGAGSVEQATGTRRMDELGGVSGKMPATWLSTLAGSLAISGVPPFNGFWSKLFIIMACVQTGRLWLALVAVIGSVLTMAAFLKVQRHAFMGQLKESLSGIKEAPLAMTIPLLSLALACLLIGLLSPFVVSGLINPAVAAVAAGPEYGRIMIGGIR